MKGTQKERGDIKNRVIGIKERVVGLRRQNGAWFLPHASLELIHTHTRMAIIKRGWKNEEDW